MIFTKRHLALRKAVAWYLSPMRLCSKHGYLTASGWIETMRTGKCVDTNSKPIPWWSYCCISFLEGRLDKTMSVFEYGSGYSTLWLAERVGRVTSIEDDKDWYDRIKKSLPGNVELCFLERGEGYCRSVLADVYEYDLVILDGWDRVKCTPYAIEALNPSGVILFDDADVGHLRQGSELLEQAGFRQIDFHGLAPMGLGPHLTRIFYRDFNCLGI